MKKVDNSELISFYIEKNNISSIFSKEIISKMQLYFLKKGEYVCKIGDRLDYLFFIVRGKCSVFQELANGKTLLICFYEDFQVLGEFEFFDNNSGKTNIQTIEDTHCLAIPLQVYKEELMNDNKLLRFLCLSMCKKLERSDKNNSINLLYFLENRLASYILSIQKDNYFCSNYTHLAEYLGVSHRHLLRTLADFCGKGLLEKREGKYYINDMKGLRELARDFYD